MSVFGENLTLIQNEILKIIDYLAMGFIGFAGLTFVYMFHKIIKFHLGKRSVPSCSETQQSAPTARREENE